MCNYQEVVDKFSSMTLKQREAFIADMASPVTGLMRTLFLRTPRIPVTEDNGTDEFVFGGISGSGRFAGGNDARAV